MLFTFTLIVIMVWAVNTGFVQGTGLLLLGLFQLGLVPGYLVGSKLLFEAGNSLIGNIFLIFTGVFGGISGLFNTAMAITGYLGIDLDMRLYFFPLLWAGLVLLASTIAIRKADTPTFLTFFTGTFVLLFTALIGLGIIPPVLNSVVGVLSIIVAVCGFYTVFADICIMGGVNMPKGKAFFK